MMNRVTYSPKLKEALEELKPAFNEVADNFAALRKRRAAIAPAFAKAYKLWQRETKKPYIAFIHALDPSMPVTDRDAYRNHDSYRAGQYLLQLADGEEKAGPSGRTPLAMLALTIKTLLPLSHPHQKETLAILLNATGWRDRDQTSLLAKVNRTRGVQLPHLPRLVKTAEASKAAIAFRLEKAS